jgi:hypothetical protein
VKQHRASLASVVFRRYILLPSRLPVQAILVVLYDVLSKM